MFPTVVYQLHILVGEQLLRAFNPKPACMQVLPHRKNCLRFGPRFLSRIVCLANCNFAAGRQCAESAETAPPPHPLPLADRLGRYAVGHCESVRNLKPS